MLDERSVRGWEGALKEVESLLDLDTWGAQLGTVTAAARDTAVKDHVGPRLEAFEARSDDLTQQANAIADEQERALALSTLAQGDIEAALVTLELADQLEDGGVVTASATGSIPTPPIADALAEVLRDGAPPVAATAPSWKDDLETSLEKVASESAKGIVKIGGSAATAAVAGNLTESMAKVASGLIPQVFDQAKAALTWLKAKALDLLERGLAKITELFGDEVKKALDDWIKAQLDKAPTAIVAQLAGVPGTVAAWTSAAGTKDLNALVAQVKGMEAARLNTLRWADRGVKAYGFIAPTLMTAAVVGIPGPVVVAVIGLALAGWMFWVAYDHSHDARALVS